MVIVGRGDFLFVTWKGNHSPRHVHGYRHGQLMVKWDLEAQAETKGRATSRIRALIAELERGGAL